MITRYRNALVRWTGKEREIIDDLDGLVYGRAAYGMGLQDSDVVVDFEARTSGSNNDKILNRRVGAYFSGRDEEPDFADLGSFEITYSFSNAMRKNVFASSTGNAKYGNTWSFRMLYEYLCQEWNGGYFFIDDYFEQMEGRPWYSDFLSLKQKIRERMARELKQKKQSMLKEFHIKQDAYYRRTKGTTLQGNITGDPQYQFVRGADPGESWGSYMWELPGKSPVKSIHQLRSKILKTWHDDFESGRIRSYLTDAEQYETLSDDEIIEAFNPTDIVLEAWGWDSPEFNYWIYDRILDGSPGMTLDNGAVLYDEGGKYARLVDKPGGMPRKRVFLQDAKGRISSARKMRDADFKREVERINEKYGDWKNYEVFKDSIFQQETNDFAERIRDDCILALSTGIMPLNGASQTVRQSTQEKRERMPELNPTQMFYASGQLIKHLNIYIRLDEEAA